MRKRRKEAGSRWGENISAGGSVSFSAAAAIPPESKEETNEKEAEGGK